MARYIDADKLKERLLAISVVSDDLYGMGINRGLDRAETAIDMMPTADVVPKSEEGAECPTCYGTGRIKTTDWLTKKISKEQLAKEKAKAIAEYELHIKQDYAREIFEEIENLFLKDNFRLICNRSDFIKLKKKYTEGQSDG